MALLQLHVCSVTRSAAEHNASRLRDLGVPIVPLRASHAGVGAAGGDADSYKGLPTSTLLAVGARVMLKVNLWTVHGLTNGAIMGTVFGAFTGDYKRAITQGAAVGAAGGLVQGAYESGSPDEIQRAYTQRCLGEKGYQVIGWR